ncbi:MAG TPA: hypothetical protein VHX12_11005 [Acidisoma sp.]|jgi:hypothetical protein|nr:hypothetical protein [Acidisoma sp.]
MIRATTARSPLAAVLIIIAISTLFHIVIVKTSSLPLSFSIGGLFKLGFIGFSAFAHWGLYASLLATFALTLRRGHMPLITAMAYKLHGSLTDEMIRYTRWVTVAWALFFTAQLLTSISLFCFASLTAWSVFVNLLDIPLVVTMFAAEYAVRLRVLRHPPRHSFRMMFDMVSDCMHRPPAGSNPPSGLPNP